MHNQIEPTWRKMTVAVCLAIGLKTRDLRVRDIVEKVQLKSIIEPVCLGGRVEVGKKTHTVRKPALVLISHSISRPDRNGKRTNVIRKHIGGCSTLKKGAKEGNQDGKTGRTKGRTAGKRESGKKGEEEKESRENGRRGATIRGRNDPKAGENESTKNPICRKSGLGFGV